jgi:CheY-like chemotaxis protein
MQFERPKYSANGSRLFMIQEKDPQQIAGNAPCILLIDDNAVQAAIRQTILKRAGYYVIAALNPVRALEQFKEDALPCRVSAVITDHIMPGMTGSQFVTELRKLEPTLPVMVISGLEEAEPEYAELNVQFLLKPLAPDLLLSNLQYLIKKEQKGAA